MGAEEQVVGVDAALYSEPPDAGNRHRERMLEEVLALVDERQRAASERMRSAFRVDTSSVAAYEASTEPHRLILRKTIGWPLSGEVSGRGGPPAAEVVEVATDPLGSISRLFIETLPGVRTYGLLFRPHGAGPFPLVLSQHGGLGTPELCSGFFGSSNYHDMSRRVLRRGAVVFAPQLLIWDPERFGAPHDRLGIDRRLKQTGGSLAALELYRIIRSLDYLCAQPYVDHARVGMIGLSYGGFYTLFAAALDRRIAVALSSCYLNDRYRYDSPDWTWFDSAGRFSDAEVGALVCPRPLYVEVGEEDILFAVSGARPPAHRLGGYYEELGIGERFVYHEHPGIHELDTSDSGIDFLFAHLGG